MKIRSLKIINFRNYDNIRLNFNKNLNIIYGNNGSGKTNLIEAIYALSLTKSFRSNIDKNLIRYNNDFTKIEGIIKKNKEVENKYELIISKEGKKVRIDDDQITKISDYISNINVILLQPDEHVIFNSSPSERRKLFNIDLSQLYNEYVLLLNNYNKIIKQRNFYLRELYINGNRSLDYLDILTNKLIDYGYKIYDFRKNFVDKININLNNNYQKVFENGSLYIKYISDFNKEKKEMLRKYQNNYNKEIINGKTMFGIHHDDYVFYLDDMLISENGSNGQKKNALLAFKLSEIELFKEIKGEYPILILDDLFSAMDNIKNNNIISMLDNNIQTFITTTDLDKLDDSLLKDSSKYEVINGKVKEV